MKKRKKFILLAFIIAIIASILAFVLNQNVEVPKKMKNLDMSLTSNELYLDDNDYLNEMNNTVLPYINQYFKEGYFNSDGDIKLYYRSYMLPDSKDTIVISHGFTESSLKYQEVIYYFLKSGYSVFALDHRGHGNSSREISDPSLVYIDNFDKYVTDFKAFMDKVVKKEQPNNNLYLYAHSMGGAIGTLFLEEYPNYFNAAILTTPMLGVNTGYPEFVSKTISSIYKLINDGRSYAWGQKEYDSTPNFKASAGNSKPRYDYYFSNTVNNKNYQTYSPSFAWVNSALKGSAKATEESNLEKIKIPVLLFQAENDDFVLPEDQYLFAEKVNSCEFIFVPNSKHEIYSSDIDILAPYFNTIFNFLNKQK